MRRFTCDRITIVYLRVVYGALNSRPGHTSMDQIDLIINLFRHIELFEIEIKNSNNLQLTVLYIFKKIKKNKMFNIKKCCLITYNAPNNRL
jgi:hypothetical protein